jgi:NhaP-type Na+/H+ or K+/H+ antiporter
MAYALSLKSVQDYGIGSVMLLVTLMFSLITVLVVGSVLNPILTKLNVKNS